MKAEFWETPIIKEIGDAKDLIQSSDVDGSGDGLFPLNLASV